MRLRAKLFNRLPASRMFFRVFGIFAVLMLSMTAIYGLFIIPLQQDSLSKVMYSQANTVSRSIIQACSDAMLTDDSGFIVEHNLQVLKNNQSMRSVIIVPKRGDALRIEPEGWLMEKITAAEFPPAAFERESFGIVKDASGKPSYRYITPIRFSGVVWGVMRIEFDTTEYDKNTAEMYKQIFYISMLVVLALLPLGYLFALWLTRPIDIISRAAARVAQGDLDAHVEIDRDDEIGQLSSSFNQMVDALQASRKQLQNVNLELESKVAARTHDLDELNRTLDLRIHDEIAKRKEQESLLIHQSRLAAMGEMIGAIAHQWRQPLNALSLVLQNIKMQHHMGTLSEESMDRMQLKADQLVQRMSSTIDEFRNFFKPGKHSEAFNLAQSLYAAANIVEGTFHNHNITLTIECDESLELFGVAGEFAQVVLNLLGNAKDAVLNVKQVAPSVRMRAERLEDGTRISIEDNGGGIAPDIINKIFEPYFSTKDEGKGTGIGLYMSKMIVENNMQGRLEVTNTAEGACFTIRIPAQLK